MEVKNSEGTQRGKWNFFNFAFVLLYPLGLFFVVLQQYSMFSIEHGYFTFALLLLAPMILFFSIQRSMKVNYIVLFDFLYVGFILYYIFILGFNVALSGINESNVDVHYTNIIFFTLIYLVFKGMNFDSKVLKKCIGVLLLISSVLFIYSLTVVDLVKVVISDQEAPSYQYIAELCLTASLVYLSLESASGKRMFLIFLLFIMLFLNGARSEFFGFIIGVLVIEYLWAKSKIKYSFALMLFTISLITAGVYLSDDLDARFFRVIDLIQNASDSSSAVARARLFEEGWVNIEKSPVMGSFASYEPGNYIHNVFSAWHDLGVVGFLYLIILYSISSLHFKNISGQVFNPKLRVLIVFILVSMLLILSAKTFYYWMVPATLGLASNNFLNKREKVSLS